MTLSKHFICPEKSPSILKSQLFSFNPLFFHLLQGEMNAALHVSTIKYIYMYVCACVCIVRSG